MTEQQAPPRPWQEEVEGLYRDRLIREFDIFFGVTMRNPRLSSAEMPVVAHGQIANQVSMYLELLQQIATEYAVELSEVLTHAQDSLDKEAGRLLMLEPATATEAA